MVDPKQLAVYEEFVRNVPGFLPTNDLSQPTGFFSPAYEGKYLSWIKSRNLQFNLNVSVS